MYCKYRCLIVTMTTIKDLVATRSSNLASPPIMLASIKTTYEKKCNIWKHSILLKSKSKQIMKMKERKIPHPKPIFPKVRRSLAEPSMRICRASKAKPTKRRRKRLSWFGKIGWLVLVCPNLQREGGYLLYYQINKASSLKKKIFLLLSCHFPV